MTSFDRGRRNPVWIRGSGRPLRKNLVFGTLDTNRPNTDKTVEVVSSSLHSSKASITIAVIETTDSASDRTINFYI